MRSFRNRCAAGRELAAALRHHASTETVVLALGPGGVYVASQVANDLGAKLDVLIVRDIIVGDATVGVITEGGVPMLHPEIDLFALNDIQRAIAREIFAVEQTRHRFRGTRAFPNVTGATVILIDDLIETPDAMLASQHLVRRKGAERVVIATPIARQAALDALAPVAEEILALARPHDLYSVYDDSESLTDQDVQVYLQRARLAQAHNSDRPSGTAHRQ